jgi:hypothetical protein
MFVSATINPINGHVWLGPEECKRALLGSQIVGALVTPETKELELFREYGIINVVGDTATGFQEILRSFSADLVSNTFKEARNIPLTDLPGINIPSSIPIWMRTVDVKDGNLRVLLMTGWPDKFLEVIIGNSLELISARLRPAGYQ